MTAATGAAGARDLLAEAKAALRRLKRGAWQRPERGRTFTEPRWLPIRRRDRAAMLAFARKFTGDLKEPGEHGGPLTRAFVEVLRYLLGKQHGGTGACFPSYDRIHRETGIARSVVAEAIKFLEAAKLLTVVNRYRRKRERVWDAEAGRHVVMDSVRRTSNAYVFSLWWRAVFPEASKSGGRTESESSENPINYNAPPATRLRELERELSRESRLEELNRDSPLLAARLRSLGRKIPPD